MKRASKRQQEIIYKAAHIYKLVNANRDEDEEELFRAALYEPANTESSQHSSRSQNG
jgi:hypothetical protein